MKNLRYYSFKNYLTEKYGVKVRRISLDAGFGCPHRQGGGEGCLYCNGAAFSPFAGAKLPLRRQIERTIRFNKDKGLAEKFIAYFQNGTNTWGDIDELKKAYDAVYDFPDIVGLYVSTRPDCVDEEKLRLIASYKPGYDVWIEYGVQTVHDRTLRFINRQHMFSDSEEAIEKTHAAGISVCAHVILGLPGESADDMMLTARKLSIMPVSGVKLHVLHILRETKAMELYLSEGIRIMSMGEYVRSVCDFIENLRKDIVVMRLVSDAGKDVLVAPKWVNNKLEVIDRIRKEFFLRGSFQGCRCVSAIR